MKKNCSDLIFWYTFLEMLIPTSLLWKIVSYNKSVLYVLETFSSVLIVSKWDHFEISWLFYFINFFLISKSRLKTQKYKNNNQVLFEWKLWFFNSGKTNVQKDHFQDFVQLFEDVLQMLNYDSKMVFGFAAYFCLDRADFAETGNWLCIT